MGDTPKPQTNIMKNLFMSLTRISRSNGNVTIVGEELPTLGLCWPQKASVQGVIFVWLTICCDTRPRLFAVSSDGPSQFSHLLQQAMDANDVFYKPG